MGLSEATGETTGRTGKKRKRPRIARLRQDGSRGKGSRVGDGPGPWGPSRTVHPWTEHEKGSTTGFRRSPRKPPKPAVYAVSDEKADRAAVPRLGVSVTSEPLPS